MLKSIFSKYGKIIRMKTQPGHKNKTLLKAFIRYESNVSVEECVSESGSINCCGFLLIVRRAFNKPNSNLEMQNRQDTCEQQEKQEDSDDVLSLDAPALDDEEELNDESPAVSKLIEGFCCVCKLCSHFRNRFTFIHIKMLLLLYGDLVRFDLSNEAYNFKFENLSKSLVKYDVNYGDLVIFYRHNSVN